MMHVCDDFAMLQNRDDIWFDPACGYLTLSYLGGRVKAALSSDS